MGRLWDVYGMNFEIILGWFCKDFYKRPCYTGYCNINPGEPNRLETTMCIVYICLIQSEANDDRTVSTCQLALSLLEVSLGVGCTVHSRSRVSRLGSARYTLLFGVECVVRCR